MIAVVVETLEILDSHRWLSHRIALQHHLINHNHHRHHHNDNSIVVLDNVVGLQHLLYHRPPRPRHDEPSKRLHSRIPINSSHRASSAMASLGLFIIVYIVKHHIYVLLRSLTRNKFVVKTDLDERYHS